MKIYIARLTRIVSFGLGSFLLLGGYQNCGDASRFKSQITGSGVAELSSGSSESTTPPQGQPVVLVPSQFGITSLVLSKPQLVAGDTVDMSYSWAGGPSPQPLTVFVHFIDSNGTIAFQDDHKPPVSTTDWTTSGQTYTRKFTVSAVANGTYKIAVGLFDSTTGARMKLSSNGLVTDMGDGRYQVGALSATPSPNAPVLAESLTQLSPCATAGGCSVSGAITVSVAGTVLKNLKISNPNGDCITVNAANVTIQDSEIGPCLGRGVISWQSGTKIVGNYFHNTKYEAIYGYGSAGLTVQKNRMETIAAGVRAVSSQQVVIERNYIRNVMGVTGMGNLVQFDKVTGGGSRVFCNVGTNELNKSFPEDLISMYASSGTSQDPIMVVANKVQGGGPSASGGGILLGDGDGSYTIAKNNVLVDPGQYGIGIVGGNHLTLTSNLIYGRQQSFTNVGVQIWDFYKTGNCNNNSVTYNKMNFTNSAGTKNNLWNAGTCGPIAGLDMNSPVGTNVWNAPIDATLFDQVIADCK